MVITKQQGAFKVTAQDRIHICKESSTETYFIGEGVIWCSRDHELNGSPFDEYQSWRNIRTLQLLRSHPSQPVNYAYCWPNARCRRTPVRSVNTHAHETIVRLRHALQANSLWTVRIRTPAAIASVSMCFWWRSTPGLVTVQSWTLRHYRRAVGGADHARRDGSALE